MEQNRLLHTVLFTLRSCAQISGDLRRARLAHERAGDRGTLLFFCDLPDADAPKRPDDSELIRCIQSGVMSMAARRPGQYLFLVRRRSFDNAARTYLGQRQLPAARTVLHTLLTGSGDRPAFEAANFVPESLKGMFDAVLVSDAQLRFAPDTPARMLHALHQSERNALRGEILLPPIAQEPLFARLVRADFTLLPPSPHFRGAPIVHNFLPQDEPPAAIYTACALAGDPPADTAEGCTFLLSAPPSLQSCFDKAALSYTRCPGAYAALPAVQMLLLFASAWLGFSWLAAICLLPELHALMHPSRLPGALVRLAFLPRHAAVFLDALLRRLCAGKRFQLSLSSGTGTCVVCGGALLFLAMRGLYALPPLMVLALLWLGAPLIERALALPARERIPLHPDERARLHALAKGAFADVSPAAVSPAHLLCACGGCMLGLLEPDEAARRMESMLGRLSLATPFDHACALTAAQYIASRMGECDAALRELPAQLIALQATQPLPESGSRLCALLAIARENTSAPDALTRLKTSGPGDTLDALFLPRETANADAALLPITHPHTFLHHLGEDTLKEKSGPPLPAEEASRFLILVSSDLQMPFAPLLAQSSLIAPYMPLLDQI